MTVLFLCDSIVFRSTATPLITGEYMAEVSAASISTVGADTRPFILRRGSCYEVVFITTSEWCGRYLAFSGDTNPIHRGSSKFWRFERPIIPGAAFVGYASAIIGNYFPYSVGRSIKSVSFVKPIMLDDTVTMRIRVTWVRRRKLLRILQATMRVEFRVASSEKPAVQGSFTILVPS